MKSKRATVQLRMEGNTIQQHLLRANCALRLEGGVCQRTQKGDTVL